MYRYLNIGSGKPGRDVRESVRHYCINIVDPDYPFTAGDFCREARSAGERIERDGRIPLFVGGTGLYIDSFFDGLSDIPPVDLSVRRRLLEELDERGLEHLYEVLREADPVFAGSIHRNDRQRIIRGLEVFRGTGEPLSSYFGAKQGYGSPRTVYIGLYDRMEVLRERIDRRVERMMETGFFDEVVALRAMGYGPHLKSMKSIGYHEINLCLDRGADIPETVAQIKANTKKYAKRQMTWFRKNSKIEWFRLAEKDKIVHYIQRVMGL